MAFTHESEKTLFIFSVVDTFVFVYKWQKVFGKDNLSLKDFIVSKNGSVNRLIEIKVGCKISKLTPIKICMQNESFFIVDDNQNPFGELTNIYVMRAGDHERKI